MKSYKKLKGEIPKLLLSPLNWGKDCSRCNKPIEIMQYYLNVWAQEEIIDEWTEKRKTIARIERIHEECLPKR